MSKAEFEAVVRLNPTDQQTRFMKVPRKARPASYRKYRPKTNQFFSCLMKKGNRTMVEMVVRMAEKPIGESSRRTILAKR